LPATHAEAETVPAHWTEHYTFDNSRTSLSKCHCSEAASCRTIQFSQDALLGVNINSTSLAWHQVATSAFLCGEKLSHTTYSLPTGNRARSCLRKPRNSIQRLRSRNR